jgi:uncharacterized protein (DUF1684 family)
MLPAKSREEYSEQREEIHQAALDVIRRQGYTVSHAVADMTGFSLLTVAQVLKQNANEWGLKQSWARTSVKGYSTGRFIDVYAQKRRELPKRVELGSHRAYKLKYRRSMPK